jgi:hypothetical protein
MAMFNFNLDGQKEVAKPMRSYVDIDENGRPKARIYADEYDSVKSNPDFQPYLTGAGRNMETAQSAFADEMTEARIEAVEKRIKAKRQETIKAETEAREAQAEDNVYSGPDFLGSIGGFRKTFTEKATSRQEELKKLLEERSGYMGTPEISAPMPTEQAPVSEPAAQVQQAPQKRTVKIRNPDGKILSVPVEMWNKNPKGYIEQGYQVVP